MSVVKLAPLKRTNSAALALSFESATAEIIAQQHPIAQRAVLYILALFVVFVIVFMSVFHLDRVVNATGRLVPVAGTITVQPLEKAIITKILVSVGDKVKKGQVLATLDPTFVKADLGQLQQKVASLGSQKRRLEAEEADKPFQADPAQPYDLLQDSIWRQRSTEFRAGIADFDQRISSSEAAIAGYRQSIVDFKAQLKNAEETEHMYTEMEREKIASHLQSIEMQQLKLEAARKLDEAENLLATTEHLLESLKEQKKVYVDKWHDDNLSNLVVTRNELEEAGADLTKANKMSDLVSLVSPADAVVLRIPSLSQGGVVSDAEPMFSLIPADAELEVDAQIDSKDSGFVKVGDRAKIKFEAYRFLEHGAAEGVVKTISQDAFTEISAQDEVTRGATTQSRTPYFDARIKVTALNLHDVPATVHLVPGMTLQADIIVGRRTLMWFLLGGALRSGSEAMREP